MSLFSYLGPQFLQTGATGPQGAASAAGAIGPTGGSPVGASPAGAAGSAGATGATGATGASWTPNILTSLSGWYRGSEGYGGGLWTDKTANANNLTLLGTTGGSGLNSLSTVLFNGVSDAASKSGMSMPGVTGLTIYMVAKVISITGIQYYADYDGLNHAVWSNAGGGDNLTYNSNGAFGGGNPSTLTGNWKRFGITDDGTTGIVFINGSDVGNHATPTVAGASGKTFSVGRGLTSNFSNIDVAEVVVCSAALSAADLASLDKYFKNRYGL